MTFSSTNGTSKFSVGNETDMDLAGPGWSNISNGTDLDWARPGWSNVSNGTDLDQTEPEWNSVELLQVTGAVLAILFSLLGLHTNIIMLSVIISELRHNIWVSTNVLLLNLCILDTCICMIFLWEGVVMVDSYEVLWPHCPKFCYQLHILSTTLAPMRVFFAMALAISHYITCTQNDALFTRWCTVRNSLGWTVFVWVSGLVVITPMVVNPPESIMQVVATCNVDWPYSSCYPGQHGVVSKPGREIALIITNTSPVAIIGILSVITHCQLERSFNNVANPTEEIPMPVKIAARVLVKMAIVYTVLALPRVSWQVCNLMRLPMPSVLHIVFKFSQHFASVVNPMLYGSEKPLFIKRCCLLPDGSVVDVPYP